MTLSVLYKPRATPFETTTVGSKKIACDGNGSDSGHPRVYLNMGDNAFVDCPYCSRRYVYKEPPKKLPPKVQLKTQPKAKKKPTKKPSKKSGKKPNKQPVKKAIKKTVKKRPKKK